MNFLKIRNASLLKTMTKLCLRLINTQKTEQFKPILKKCLQFPDNIAVVDNHGSFKYKDLMYFTGIISKKINASIPNHEATDRISFACSNNATYVCVLLACWLSGKIAVPLSASHPMSVIEYYVKDSQSSMIIADDVKSEEMQKLASQSSLPFLFVEHPSSVNGDKIDQNDVISNDILNSCLYVNGHNDVKSKGAMLLYTSGTTGSPKGVLLTHNNFDSQVAALLSAWEWSSSDVILHTLPLYHLHGIMNALLCPLSIGATVVMRSKFDPAEVWEYLLDTHCKLPRVNLFFGVPTMYVKLIKEVEKWTDEKRIKSKDICRENIRLLTSGSAPLPPSIFEQWENITGHRILERYGMSEIGMALSNPLKGPRTPGCVGNPLPGVKVRVTDVETDSSDNYLVNGTHEEVIVTHGCEGKSGELLVKGPSVFKEYWQKPETTRHAFTNDGWFKTGDTAVYENGTFKLLGRTSLDVIKSSGYKISALYVESHLLMHPDIVDCAVFGIPDDERGEKIVTIFVCKCKNHLPMQIRTWCMKHIPAYSVPSMFVHVENIPRNAMGKVNKKELKYSLFSLNQ